MQVRRLVLTHKDRERYVQLEPGKECLVGRLLEASFFLNDPSVSRRHCVLRASATGVELEDLVSRNSTLLNGQRVLTRTLVSDGSLLQIGRVPFSVRVLDGAPTATCAACGAESPTSQLTGTPDGRLACAACAERYASERGNQLHEVVEAQGYVVRENLGGIPVTLRVERAGLGKAFTIKALDTGELARERLDRVRSEARQLAALEHPAITAIYDVIETGDVLLVVMANETGEPLEAVVRRGGPLAPGVALEVARRCADAVRYASSRGIVHRQITPTNVLVGKGFPQTVEVRLTNFPATRDLSELSRSFSVGADLDRLLYVAPEAVGDPDVTVKADVFGIGALLLYGLTGRPPHGGAVPAAEHVRRVASGEPLAPVLDGVPAFLVDPLRKLLAWEPGVRPATPEAVLALLDAAIVAAEGHSEGDRAFRGGFAGEELVEYLQLLELNRKTGEVEIAGEGLSGKLWFVEGRLDGAIAPGLEGLPAARRLIGLPRGKFCFTPDRTGSSKGVRVNLAALILDVLRERDEAQRGGA